MLNAEWPLGKGLPLTTELPWQRRLFVKIFLYVGYDGTIRYIMKGNGSELEQVVYTVTSNIVR